MNNLVIVANQTPGVVTFDNFAEVKTNLQQYIQEHFETVDYVRDGLSSAKEDFSELKDMRGIVTSKKKELESAYSAPYTSVEKMLDELIAIIDDPYKRAKTFVEEAEKEAKRAQVMEYAGKMATELGETGSKIIASPAFFNEKWKNKTFSQKKYQDEINGILQQAAKDIAAIQATGGDNTAVLLARYYETLSMDGVKSFLDTINEEHESIDSSAIPTEKNAVGYKVLKITATEDQMASILDMLELMGVEVEEQEDGMPKEMEELTDPSFDSFVAFDIETTGTNGVANGDGEAKITEIGAVRVENGVVVDKFDMLANPGRKIVPRIARLTHITDEMVADQPPVEEVIRKFHAFVGDSILVGHNIKSSDLRYITKAADQAGIHFGGAFLDTYLLAQKHREEKGWESVKLGYLAEAFGCKHQEAHRAWSDAEVNAEVYFELQKL